VLSHRGEVDLRCQLAELLGNGLADDVLEFRRDCSEELLLQLGGHQLQNPGVRSVTSCFQQIGEQGVPVGRSEPLRRWLECLYESGGSDVLGGDSIADHGGEVVEVGAAGGQLVDCAGVDGHW
jgi:hypothetical protein